MPPSSSGGGPPLKLNPIPKGKSLDSTFQQPRGVELVTDDVQVIARVNTAPGYSRPTIGSAHPDATAFPSHFLLTVVPDPATSEDRLYYVIARSPVVSSQTNALGQIETVTRSLVADNATLPTASAILRYTFSNLANGRAEKTVTGIPSVFSAVEYAKDRPDVTPTKFKALIPIIETSTTAAGSASAPTLAAGDVRASDRQTTLFEHRTSVANRAATSLPTSIVSKLTNPKKQIITRTETLEADSTTPAVPTALLDVSFEKLGDGTALETQDAIPSVFDAQSYRKSAPDPAPLKFRIAAPTTTSETVSAATSVSSPSLGTGELARSEERVDSFTKRSSVTSRAAISLPVSIVSKKTNANKQVVTVTEILEADSTTPAVPTALLDVSFEKLGDGTAVETQEAVASVFDKDTRSIEIPDVTPAWAKALLPTTATSSEAAATSVSDPTLSTGQISKRVRRTTEKTVQTDITSRDTASLPKTRTNKELTAEFGGSVIDEVQTQAVGAQSPSSGGLMVVDSKVEILGDGTSVLSTKTAEDGSWPVLSGTKVDENLRIAIPYTKQVVAAGTAGGIVDNILTEVTPLDKWRSITIASTIPDDLSELDVTYPTTRNHIFPDTITDAVLVEVWVESTSDGTRAYAFDAQVKYKLKSGYRGPCDGQIIETYTTTPDATSYPVTKFFPEQFIGYTSFFYGFAGDNVVAQARVIVHTLPSSLHDEIDLTPTGPDTDGLVVPATDPIELPTPGTLITIDRSTERWRFGIWRNQVTQIYVP